MKHLREYAEYLICFLLLAIVFGGTLFLNQNQPPLDTRTYAETLFDNSRVHKIEIFINDADKTRLWENAIYKPKLHVNVSVDGEMLSNVSFSTHGNATLANNFELNNYGVYSYKIIFNYFNEAQTYRGLDKLILKYPIEDISWIREAMTTAIFQAADVPVSLTSYAEVFINGESQGLRILQEEVSSSFQARNNLSQNSAIFKPEAINVDRDRYIKYQARLPEGQLNTLDQEKLPSFGGGAELIFHGNQSSDYPDIFENAIKKYSPAEEVLVINAIKALCESKSVSDYWNLTEIANYFAAQNLIFDMDGYTGAIAHNYYLVINNGKLELYPWDNGHSAKNAWLNAWVLKNCWYKKADILPVPLNPTHSTLT